MRPIDADEYERELLYDMTLHGEQLSGDAAYNRALVILTQMPSLTPPNEPLTLDELREMDGEPVWIKRLKRLSVCNTGWAVVDVCPNQIRVWWFGSEVEDEPSEKDYGETWLAYRRPSEGEEDT